jgi:protein dpy-30
MDSADPDFQRTDQPALSKVEALAQLPPRPLPDHCLPTHDYMQKYVLPFLEPAMKATALHRPKNPIEFFSYYLLAQRGQQAQPEQ